VATLFGTVDVWRRLYEPLERGVHSMHPLERRLGIEAGCATPALAERVGQWAADHTQRQVLTMLAGDHDVHWSSTSLRKVLASLSTGMAKHRHVSQIEHVVHWLEQARVSTGRYRPTLAVGRDGIFVPLQHQVWQEGDDLSSPDEISHKLSNINGLRFYHLNPGEFALFSSHSCIMEMSSEILTTLLH
jgi:hypothetical protein